MEIQPPEDTVRLPASQPISPAPAQPAAIPPSPQTPATPAATGQPHQAVGQPVTDTAPRLPSVTPNVPKKTLTSKQRLLAILGALLIALVVIVSAGIIIAQPGEQAKVTTTPSATSQVPQATQTIASPIAQNSAPLGSPLQTFTTTFGKPTVAYTDSVTYVASVKKLQARIFVALAPGKDGAQHGQDIHVEPDTGAWNLDMATAIMLQFLPSDTQHQTDVAGPNGVTYHVYRSNALAQIFPATTFTTTTRQTATAGGFSWFCASDLSFCYIGPLVPGSGS